MRVKFFFNGQDTRPEPVEKEIQKWLDENQRIEIVSVTQGSYLQNSHPLIVIFYKEKKAGGVSVIK